MAAAEPEWQAEVDALKALYCGDGEFQELNGWQDEAAHANRALSATATSTSAAANASAAAKVAREYSFALSLELDATHLLRAVVTLPPAYGSAPSVIPTISVTGVGAWLSSPQTVALNAYARNYVATLAAAAADAASASYVVLDTVSHLRADAAALIERFGTPPTTTGLSAGGGDASAAASAGAADHVFVREWVLFHHMYSGEKKKTIVEAALRYGLTGLSMPGKPGVVVVEGLSGDVFRFVAAIRALNWQKMSTKVQQKIDLSSAAATAATASDRCHAHRLWQSFAEIVSAPGSGGGGQHADVSQFMALCTQRGLQHIAREVLGLPASSAAATASAASSSTAAVASASAADTKTAAVASSAAAVKPKTKAQLKAEGKAAAAASASSAAPAGAAAAPGKSKSKKSDGGGAGDAAAASSAPLACVRAADRDGGKSGAGGGGVFVAVSVQPNASATALTGIDGLEASLRLAAAPKDGAANTELCRFLSADVFGCSKKDVSVVRGAASRDKTVRIADATVTPASASAALRKRWAGDNA